MLCFQLLRFCHWFYIHISMAQTTAFISGVTTFSAINSAFNMTVNPNQDPDDKLRSIVNWFTSINFRTVQHDTFSKHTPGTGTWFVESPGFQSLLSTNRGFLWAKGPPGAGKTILSSIAINHLLEHFSSVQETAVIFAYCRYTDRPSITDILASFVKQLAQDHESVVLPIIEPIYNRHWKKETRPGERELQELLKQLLNLFKKTYIVIDALDEVACERGDLLEVLRSLPASLLLTSRPLEILERHHSNTAYIHVDAENWEDIELSIETQIDKSVALKTVLQGKEADRKDICAKLMEKSQGMFLLAALQIDSLKHCISIKKLRTAVESLPSGLNVLYERTWERIEAQTEDEVFLATKTIIWLTYAYQPLKVIELQHAVMVSDGFDEDDIVAEELIVSVCCGLVVVDQQSGFVRLVHYTAYDFFKTYSSGLFARPRTLMTTSCLAYLSAFDFAQQAPLKEYQLEKFLGSHPLLYYAYRRWGFHSKACYGEGGLPAAVFTFLAQCDTYPFIPYHYGRTFDLLKPGHVAACYGLSSALPTTNEWCNQVTGILRLTPLMLASANGHEAVVENLLCRKDANIDSQDMKTALLEASRGGHEPIVKLLLSRNDVDINSQDKSGQSALFMASFNGHRAIVALLLSRKDVAMNMTATAPASQWRPVAGQTALLVASRGGHEAIVKLLLSRKDIDINAQDEDGQTALFAATLEGDEAIVNLLLSRKDVDINSRASDGQTALLAAAREGHEAIVKLLLRSNIDINSQDKDGQTALFAASLNGHEAIVALLLSRKHVAINTNTASIRSGPLPRSGQTALLVASRDGHEAIVKLLLSRNDVNINPRDGEGQTALVAASREGHEAIVKLLLSRKDVDINLRDSDGQTALFASSFNGHAAIVALLLSRKDVATNITATIKTRLFRKIFGQTVLLAASRQGHEAIVELLLSRTDVDINSRGSDGQTALFAASLNGHGAVVALLLSRPDVAINAMASVGPKFVPTLDQTALFAASRKGHGAVVELLLSRNDIDINARDGYGQTALSIASIMGHEAIVELLRSRNAM